MTVHKIDHEPMTWLSVNLKSGGLDFTPVSSLMPRIGHVDIRRLDRLGELVMFAGFAPDVIFFQEGRTFDVNGEELKYYSERVLRRTTGIRYRGFLTRSDGRYLQLDADLTF